MRKLKLFTLILSTVLAACSLWAAGSEANPSKQHVHLAPSTRLHQWHSGRVIPSTSGVAFSIWANGREIDGRGKVVSDCTYMLFTRRVALELSSCGDSKLRISYISTEALTVRWWVKRV